MVVFLIFYVIIHSLIISLLIVFLNILFALFLIYKSAMKRLEELNRIKAIIRKIRKSNFNEPEDFQLKIDLPDLRDEFIKMYNKLKSDIQYLRKLEKIRTEFLGNVSHELRTPIFAIQSSLETLLKGALEDKNVNKRFIEKAHRHTISLNSLLNDLIDISMIESGEMRMSYRFFDAALFFKNLYNEFLPIANQKGLELSLSEFNENLRIYGDKEKLKQVFVNLLTNAIKYTDEGKVEIFVLEGKSEVEIGVKDTGIGISESDISRIFERFYRVDKARSREVGGTGLGLAIVKHIVEAHHSKIIVSSKLGSGSIFSFKLKK